MRVPSWCPAAALGLLALAAPAAAQTNLLVNPGFETGTFAGYTVGGNATAAGVAVAGTSAAGVNPIFGQASTIVRTGQFGAFGVVCATRTFGPPDSCPDGPEALRLSQTIAVAPGTRYDAGLYFGARTSATDFSVGLGGNLFDILIDGVGLLGGGVPGVGDGVFRRAAGTFDAGGRTSVTVTYVIVGSGTARTLLSVDDLFVQVSPTQVVPEPSAVALVGAGLALLGAAGARRRRRA